MAIVHKKEVAALVLGLGLAATPALAQTAPGGAGCERCPSAGAGNGSNEDIYEEPEEDTGGPSYGSYNGPGEGTYGPGVTNEGRGGPGGPAGGAGGYGGMGGPGMGGPGMGGPGMGGYAGEGPVGPGVGQPGPSGVPGVGGGNLAAPVPQYVLADASLFIGNAANAANILANEQALGVRAPQILGSQAEFLVSATNRALSRLIELQQNAQATNPAAVPEIRMAIGQLVPAQAQATQIANAANAGVVGPAFAIPVRSALAHLQAAGQAMIGVGRAFGVPELAIAGACPLGGGGAIGPGGPAGGMP